MNETTSNNRFILYKTIINLEYKIDNTVPINLLPEAVKNYKHMMESKKISDFIMIPHRERDWEGLSRGEHYVFYVKK